MSTEKHFNSATHREDYEKTEGEIDRVKAEISGEKPAEEITALVLERERLIADLKVQRNAAEDQAREDDARGEIQKLTAEIQDNEKKIYEMTGVSMSEVEERESAMGKEIGKHEANAQEPKGTEGEKTPETKETGSLEVGSNLRQQNKIIKILETGNLNILNEPEITLSEAERGSFLKKLQAGEITNDAIRTLIEGIQPPFGGEYGLQGLYGELLKNDDLQRAYEGLLQSFVYPGGRIREGYHYLPENMVHFFTKFPTPNDLESALEQAIKRHEEELKTIPNKERASALKMDLMFRKQQQSQVEKLKPVLYGKRYEYWQQMKILKNEASL